MKNKNGFTLIELLAVIIILGILMIIAIPSVTKYINDSRKSAYVDTAKEIVSGTRNIVNGGKLGMYDTGTTYYIPAAYINTENGLKSPYGEFTETSAYVGVIYDGKGYNYYWISSDDTGQGVPNVTLADKLDVDDIKSNLNLENIKPTIENTGIGNRKIIKILKTDGTWENPIILSNTNNNITEDGTGESVINQEPICRPATTLHTTTCNNGYGCRNASGIGNGATIEYGKLWNGTSSLSSGVALDCDVTGTGNYERFYYVTSSGSGTNKKAILIYYTNISNDGTTIAASSQINYKNDTSDNWHGPRIAYQYLPSVNQWSNNQIIIPESNRQIVNENGGITTNGGTIQLFTYSDRAARFLTYQEVQKACGNGTVTATGYLDNCNYLLENIPTYELSSTGWGLITGYWLETPYSPSPQNVWGLYGNERTMDYNSVHTVYATVFGVRPVIEVLETNIKK